MLPGNRPLEASEARLLELVSGSRRSWEAVRPMCFFIAKVSPLAPSKPSRYEMLQTVGAPVPSALSRNAFRQRTDGDFIAERAAPLSGIDDPELVQFQVGEGGLHRAGERGGVSAFEFDADFPAVKEHQEVEFASAVDRVKIGVVRLVRAQDFLERKALP